MRAARVIGGFFVQSMIVYSLLLAMWPILGGTYANLFRTTGNCLVGLGSNGRVWFSPSAKGDENHDTQLVLVDPQTGAGRRVSLSSRGHGYLPTAFVLALTLSSPIRWRRRFWATAWGLVWIDAYIALKLALFPVAYGAGDTIELFPEVLSDALRHVFWVIGTSATGWMIVPLIIWALATIRHKDWPTIVYGTACPINSNA